MSTISPTIWIDMTDLAVWKGHFTGIQRVVYNIAKGYDDDHAAKYFIFNEKQNSFHEFDFGSFRAQVEASMKPQQGGPVISSRKQFVISTVKGIYILSPEPIKRILPPHKLKKIARGGKRVYLATKRNTLRAPKLKFYQAQKTDISFRHNDSVLILGNSWDRPSLLKTLGSLKLRHGFKVFQMVYDLIPTFQPQSFNEELYNIFTKNMFEVATVSDSIMAISESTKTDMEKFCKLLSIKCPPIKVIRLGDDIPSSDNPSVPMGINKTDEYVLCVGTIEARKNHTLLYYAWKEGLSRGHEMPKLVIVGKRGWYTDNIIHTFKNDPEMIEKVIILENTNDDQLVWLYQNCQFTVYPSYYEGWGLPVAESLAMGKVCVTTDASSMPEIINGLVETCSPFDSGKFADLISSYLDKNNLKNTEKRIKSEYKQSSWTDTYRSVKSVINQGSV